MCSSRKSLMISFSWDFRNFRLQILLIDWMKVVLDWWKCYQEIWRLFWFLLLLLFVVDGNVRYVIGLQCNRDGCFSCSLLLLLTLLITVIPPIYCLRLSYKKLTYFTICYFNIVFNFLLINSLNSTVNSVRFSTANDFIVFNKNSNGLYNKEQKSTQFAVAMLFSSIIHSYVLRECSSNVLYSIYVLFKYISNTVKYLLMNYC